VANFKPAWALAAYLVFAIALSLVVLVTLWTPASQSQGAVWAFLGWHEPVRRDTTFIVLAVCGGVLGASLHGIASLSSHIANRDFDSSWTMWYLTNPAVGAALATVFLVVLQAGLGTQGSATAPINPYGVAAIATLSGLFSRHALEKLKEIFDVAFARGRSVASKGSATPTANDNVSPSPGTLNSDTPP